MKVVYISDDDEQFNDRIECEDTVVFIKVNKTI